MGRPPVDLASGDKDAPVKPATTRRSAVAPPSAIGLEAPVVLASVRKLYEVAVKIGRHDGIVQTVLLLC